MPICVSYSSIASAAPGSFVVYLPATVHRMERSVRAGAGAGIVGEQTWDFQASGGERLAVHVAYERAAPVRLGSETKFFSGIHHIIYRIVRIDRGLDIVRNATIAVNDRVRRRIRGVVRRYGARSELGFDPSHNLSAPIQPASHFRTSQSKTRKPVCLPQSPQKCVSP
jgi:hypothetical protein